MYNKNEVIIISERMNVLFIITDQQRADHLSCYNDKIVLKTPNIDKIAREGIRFTNFYCNNPIVRYIINRELGIII